MKAWHIFALGLAMIVLGALLYGEVGLESTIFYEIVILVIIAITIVVSTIAKKMGKTGKSYFRGDITPEKAKYIAAKHMQAHMNLPMFISDGGDEDLAYTRYLVNMHAERCYPQTGEEAWAVKATIHKDRFFNGLYTQILIYIDGGGRVVNDPVMNAHHGFNDRLWKNPNLYFRDIVPKTARPMSMEEVMADQMRKGGEIPESFAANMLNREE